MPHIHLETTADLVENAHIPDILDALITTLSLQESVGAAAIKASHSLRPVWAVSAGSPEGFAHCTVCILTGRPVELRRRMADNLYSVLRDSFSESSERGEASISLELREMDRETYRSLASRKVEVTP